MRHILVKTKAKADALHQQIENGGNFANLAKKNSEDPGSKSQGGKLTVSQGQTVPPFDKAAFSLDKNELSAADQDPVRLAHHRAPLRGQEGLDHPASAGQGGDQAAAPQREEDDCDA